MTFILVAALVVMPRNASAKKAAAEKKPSTALVVLGTGEGAKALVAAVEGFFTQAMRFYPEYKILHGEAGAKKLKKAAKKCKGDIPCIARIGKRSKATEVLLATVVASGGAAQVSFVAVSVQNGSITRKLEVQLASVDAARAVLAESYFAIMGVTTPGFIEIVNAPPTVTVDGAEVATAGAPLLLSPGAHVIVAAGEEQRAMVLPGKTRKLTFASLKPEPKPKPKEKPVVEEMTAAADTANAECVGKKKRRRKCKRKAAAKTATEPAVGSGTEVAAGDTDGTTELSAPAEVSRTKSAPGSTHVLAYVGYGLGGAGVLLAVIGIGFGTQASAQSDASTSQVEAARRNAAASSNADTATALIITGVAAVGIGAAAALIGTLVLSKEVSVTATASPDAAAIAFTVRW